MSEQRQDGTPGGTNEQQVLAGRTDDGRVYVVGPEEMAVAGDRTDRPAGQDGSVTDQVEEPAKVMRIATMIQRLLDEERAAPLDEASRQRLAELHATSVTELKDGLSPTLADELERLARPFTPAHTPSDDELRIAQAQLVGWLEGLFQGIQTALVAQQMAARAQLERGRRELPTQQNPLTPPHPMPGQGPGQGGMYL
ncbi:bacterial proteasome activator family protein [Raineyella sp. W15-4]|uniref:bacterial proteasome activator family protein n=1 Tax=Raineyella sp. W15-4 TaxID=3081651 RepID=UPI0029543360|nr:bacterial proteasome activator family protein [Raineyella sp. W15-4]WOQ17490.1 bacterial proteasome activator family protein [Raineyella sp. W15-4]